MYCIRVAHNKGIDFLPLNEIVRIEAKSNYSMLYFKSGKTLFVARVLHWFEVQLPAAQFIRVHRKHLVNMLFVRSINTSNTLLQLANGENINMSRRKKGAIIAA